MSEVERKEEIMEMVRQELSDDPDAENKDLYQKATKIDPSVDDLTLRQFHARFPLQVKRQMAQSRRGGRSRTSGSGDRGAGAGGGGAGVDRDAIRSILLGFARDVSRADGKAGMIDLLSSVDDYVDEVVEAVGAS